MKRSKITCPCLLIFSWLQTCKRSHMLINSFSSSSGDRLKLSTGFLMILWTWWNLTRRNWQRSVTEVDAPIIWCGFLQYNLEEAFFRYEISWWSSYRPIWSNSFRLAANCFLRISSFGSVRNFYLEKSLLRTKRTFLMVGLDGEREHNFSCSSWTIGWWPMNTINLIHPRM